MYFESCFAYTKSVVMVLSCFHYVFLLSSRIVHFVQLKVLIRFMNQAQVSGRLSCKLLCIRHMKTQYNKFARRDHPQKTRFYKLAGPTMIIVLQNKT